jgi:hypothetical protein
MDVTICFAPQPDEHESSSAALEYAHRAAQNLQSLLSQEYTIKTIRLSENSLDLLRHEEGGGTPSCIILILSCSADGSVDRPVRKIIRSLKADAKENKIVETTPTTITNQSIIAIALLGHARCENSANQMKETIFIHGRKLHQCIPRSVVKKKLEIQVELDGPDAPGGFDDWIHSIHV